MSIARALIVSSVLATVAHAQEVEPLIARPVTLRARSFDVTLHGTYTNWATGVGGINGAPSSISGEAMAFGVDYGATDRIQLGLATAMPISPGAAFGSILASAAVAVSPDAALRLDFGYDRFALNGNTPPNANTINRYFGGLGAQVRVPLSQTMAFVTGRTGAVHFGHFNNTGDSGTGLYLGSTYYPELASDFLVISDGNHGSGTDIGVNLPLGLLMQPDPHFALTLFAGYSAVILMPSSASTGALHFIPVGLEAVATLAAPIDLGLRFSIDGFLGQSGGSEDYLLFGHGYFDQRVLMFWLRFQVG